MVEGGGGGSGSTGKGGGETEEAEKILVIILVLRQLGSVLGGARGGEGKLLTEQLCPAARLRLSCWNRQPPKGIAL